VSRRFDEPSFDSPVRADSVVSVMAPIRRARPHPTRQRLAGWFLALVGVLVLVPMAQPGTAGAQQRHVVVVGDSIILGAQSAMVGAFQSAGWSIDFDAAVSRSTSAGAAAIEGHRPALTDTLVVSLGANDAGNTGAYRQKVDAIFAANAWVPHVYWLTIREVRDYYPAANQAVRDVAANYPNVTVLDWHGVTAGRSDLTSSDGLHLNGAGAAAMTELVTGAALMGVVPAPSTAAPLPAPPPAELPAPVPEAAAPPADVPAEVAPTEVPVPTTVVPETTSTAAPPTTATLGGGGDRQRSRPEETAAASTVEYESSTWPLGGVAIVVVLLAVVGAGVGGWMLFHTRSAPIESALSRPGLRAARIAAASTGSAAEPPSPEPPPPETPSPEPTSPGQPPPDPSEVTSSDAPPDHDEEITTQQS